MQLDFFTTFIVTTTILLTISLATCIFSFTRPENRSFLWAAIAGLLFSVSFLLANLRNVIPDFYSIVVFNLLTILALLSYYELFCRILGLLSPRRKFLLILPFFQVITFSWFTYVVPNFQIRVVIFNIIVLIICFVIIRLLIMGAKKDQLFSHLFSSIPFMIMGLVGLYRLLLFVLIHSVGAPSFTSSANVLLNFICMMSTIWATFSAIFLISNRLQFELSVLARIDSLTGVLNRTGLQEIMQKEIAKNKRYDVPLSLIITDLDFFKKINDTYGHIAGDAVLAHVAHLFKKNIRTEDHLARYGGEEFVFILPQTDIENAYCLAERLRLIVKNSALEYDGKMISLSCSFGVAFFDPLYDDYDSLLNKADTALYNAKNGGRDTVVRFK